MEKCHQNGEKPSLFHFLRKDKSNSHPNNRPVSLTSVACKVLEHIVHSNIMRHFDQNNFLTVKQHSFWKRRSCVTQLVTTIQGIASQLRSGRDQVDAILLDFAKALSKYSIVDYFTLRILRSQRTYTTMD